MKTDDLVSILSTNVEVVDRRQVLRNFAGAIVVGGVVSLALILLMYGLRPGLEGATAWCFLLVKLAFALGVVAFAFFALNKASRPGGDRRTPVALIVLPFVGIVLLAAISLLSAPSSHWERMIVGDEWLECLISIPIIAVVPFAAVIWAVRQAAPTNLTRAGALAGLTAGGISAMAYAFHCTDDSLPFVALWYGGTVAVCTLAGAYLGPRLLRW
jgi:hypothetical protein